MALIFPANPAAQTPVNTFSPTSTPDASTNGATYIWNGSGWTGSSELVTPPYLSLLADAGQQTVLSTDVTIFKGDVVIGPSSHILLNASGSATFVGDIDSATYNVASASGSGFSFSSNGTLTSQRNSGTASFFRGFFGITQTVDILGSGSATFASNVESNGYLWANGEASYLLVNRTGATGNTTVAELGGNSVTTRITAGGSATFAGTLGIGTDDPQATLDVNGTTIIRGDGTYLGSTSGNDNLQTKSSTNQLITDSVGGNFTFLGTINVAIDTAPSSSNGGDFYINVVDGVANSSWTGIAGFTIAPDQLIMYSSNNNRWFAGSIEDNSVYLLKTGGTMTGNITFASSQPTGTTTTKGIIQLNNATNSTSTTLAGTANSVKLAYDRGTVGVNDAATALAKAESALPKAGGSMTGNITFAAGQPLATTSVKGITQLSNSTTSTSQTLAGTANSVKTAYDIGNAALPKGGGTLSGDTIYQGSTSGNDNLQTKSSATQLIADSVGGNFTFIGPIKVSVDTAPANPNGGDFYINTLEGVAGSSWTGIAGLTIAPDQLIMYSNNNNRWFAGAIEDNSVYLQKSGGTMTGNITFASSQPTATTSTKGIVQLNSATNSTSETLAATPNAVKSAYDRGSTGITNADAAQATADAALPKVGGTMTGNITFASSQPTATTSTKGIVQLDNTVTSTSTSLASTAAAVKLAYDTAISASGASGNALPLSGGTMTGPIEFSANQPTATGSVKGILLIDNSTSSTSTTVAATSAAVKSAYDRGSTGITNAATAQAAAVAAQGTANTALTNADTADGKAVAAQGTANTALTNAATADGKAVAAQGTADTALTNAATADAKAVAAQTAADAAQTTANAALPKVGGTMTGNITFAAGQPTGTTTTKGIIQLNNATNSTSTTVAGTANSVKLAYDRGSLGVTNAAGAQTTANAALPKAGGGLSGKVTMPSTVSGDSATTLATKDYVDTDATVTSSGKTTVANDYVVVSAAGQTITLPASPATGQKVTVAVGGTFRNGVVARNGQNIMGLAENITLNISYANVTFTYAGGSQGWNIG